jgi:hypothetical protein
MGSQRDVERLRAGEVGSTITTTFTVYYSAFTADLTPKDQLICRGLPYGIIGIVEARGYREFLEITAVARSDT